jgi:MFS family permease
MTRSGQEPMTRPGQAKGRDQGDVPARAGLYRVPVVRRLVNTYTVSAIGSAMVGVAVAFVAYQQSKSIVLTVVVLAANALPALVLMPLAGRLSTGRDPRDVEVVAQIAKIGLSLAIAAVAASGGLTYAFLLVANLLNGSVSALTAPAWPRLAQAIAPEGRLAELSALFGSVAAGSAIVGALLGGVVCTRFGFTWVFVANAISYVPMTIALRSIPRTTSAPHRKRRAVRAGLRTVRTTATLKRAFVLAAVLNLAAWPVLSTLPAFAGDIDGHAHVLGFLTGAFYAGAAVVAWVVTRLRRRFAYSNILFAGFLTAGLMLLGNAALTSWRTPGYDAVTVAALTLVPIGLSISVAATLLQTIVQLASPADAEGPVLVVYATAISILTPIGGLAIGAATDVLSLWWAIALEGAALTVVSLLLRSRLTVFDELEAGGAASDGQAHGHPWALGHLGAPDLVHHALAHLLHRPEPALEPVAAAPEAIPGAA